MKVCLKVRSGISKQKLEILMEFMKFINKELPLHKDIKIELTDIKDSDMTTGVRKKRHNIKVLYKQRMLVDVLRTIGHEWVHEFQHQKGLVKGSKKYPNIGGWVENEANALSGAILKKFVKNHKNLEEILY